MKPTSTDSNDQDPVGNGTSDLNQHNECLKLLYLVLDEEATTQQREHFVEHLNNCMPCYENYNIDVAIKGLIKSKCCGQGVPKDLIESIRSKVLLSTD